MTELKGTNLSSSIVPFTTEDKFATHLAKFGKGGWRSVADTAERDGITADRREAGMAVYVVAEKKLYILADDLTSWTELDTDSGYTKDEIDGLLAAIEAQIDANADAIQKTREDYAQADADIMTIINAHAEAITTNKNDIAGLGDQVAEIEAKIPETTSTDNMLVNNQQLLDTEMDIRDDMDTTDSELQTQINAQATAITALDSEKLDKNQGSINAGKVLTVGEDGFVVPTAGGTGGGDLPDQTGNAGKFLMTDGTDVSWQDEKKYIAGKGIIIEAAFENDEYKQVEYIETSGNEYIDTGFLNGVYCIYEATFSATSIDSTYRSIFGFYSDDITSTTANCARLVTVDGVKSLQAIYRESNTGETLISTLCPIEENKWYILKSDIGGFYLDGKELLSYNQPSNEFPAKIILYGDWVGYSTDPTDSSWLARPSFIGKISNFKITQYDEGVPSLKHNFIPVKSKNTDEVGFYDLITGYFAPLVNTASESLYTISEDYDIKIETSYSIPDITDSKNKFLFTDGTDIYWQSALINYAENPKRNVAFTNIGTGDYFVSINPEISGQVGKYCVGVGHGFLPKNYSVGVGYRLTLNTYSAAVGTYSKAGQYSVAMGYYANANYNKCIAIGSRAVAGADGAIQLGEGTNNTADTLQFKDKTIIKGDGTVPYERLSTATPTAGQVLKYDGDSDSLVWGEGGGGGSAEYPDQTDNAGKFLMTDGANVSWQKAIQNNTTVDTSLAIGYNASATYTYGVAIGYNANVKNSWSIAIGYNAQALSHDQVVIGQNAAAGNKYAVAIGHNATATAEGSVQIGRGENTEQETLQFRDYTVIKQDGVIPPERLSSEPPAEGFTLVYDGQAGELRWAKSGGGETAGTEVIIRRWN